MGVEFHAADGMPVRIFVGLVSPVHSDGMHLQTLARLASLLKSPQVRNELLRMTTATGVLDVLRERERLHAEESARLR